MSQKRQSSQHCHLALLRPTSIKAERRMLMKLTPGLNLTIHTLSSNFFLLTYPQTEKFKLASPPGNLKLILFDMHLRVQLKLFLYVVLIL
jgi:hypothetical protein